MTAIYQKHFGLNRPPFQITPDTDYFFAGSQRGACLTALLHIAAHEEGIVSVVAEVGSGKTLLARQMIAELPESIGTVYLANPCFNRDEILSAIGRDLGLGELPVSIEAKLAALHQELLRRHANGERVLLVIDEAHAMPAESLEEVRLLSNLETGQHKLVNIMLFGQPELDTLLADPRLRQVHDRVIHRFELTPFSREDGAAYLEHRLRVAGWAGAKLFTDGAVGVLMKASAGRARRLNLLADKSLGAAYNNACSQVEKRHARAACDELPAIPSATTPRPWIGFALPRLSNLSLASAMLIMALAGTSVWAYTLRQLSSAPAAKTAAVTKLAPQHRIATPAETAASTPVTMTPTESPATAVAQSQPKAPTKQTMASKAITQAAQPITASITPTPTPRKPLQIAAANTSANAANTPTPALKLDTELASVQRIVPFAVSTAAFGPQGRKALAEILPLAKQAERVNVRGRTDSSGDQKKNRELAKSRATSVMFAFVAEGVSRKTLKATYCTKCFIASNDTEQGRRTNRRVDIELVMPAKLALHLPKPIHSAPDIDSEPVLLARLDEQFTSIGRRN